MEGGQLKVERKTRMKELRKQMKGKKTKQENDLNSIRLGKKDGRKQKKLK